jgi:hypothetical protein
MIEADMGHPLGIAADQSPGASQPALSGEYMLQRRKSFISFDVFREEYWVHFPQSLTKGLGPSHLLILYDVFMFSLFPPQTSHSYLASSWVTATHTTAVAVLLIIPF